MTPLVQGANVLKSLAKLVVPPGDMPSVRIADSGASHVILPGSALQASDSNRMVNFRKNAHKHKFLWAVRGSSPSRVALGQRFMYYPRNPRNANCFDRILDREILCVKVLCAFFCSLYLPFAVGKSKLLNMLIVLVFHCIRWHSYP